MNEKFSFFFSWCSDGRNLNTNWQFNFFTFSKKWLNCGQSDKVTQFNSKKPKKKVYLITLKISSAALFCYPKSEASEDKDFIDKISAKHSCKSRAGWGKENFGTI